jgi:hypothetical protein
VRGAVDFVSSGRLKREEAQPWGVWPVGRAPAIATSWLGTASSAVNTRHGWLNEGDARHLPQALCLREIVKR